MRVLFAAPDRDLLACYEKLLGESFGDVVTAFDGTQVLTLLIEDRFDVVVLDRELPRVEHRRIVRRLNDARVPVIVLQAGAVTTDGLQGETLPNACLSYPFTPAELTGLIRDVSEKASGGARFSAAGLEADTAAFRLGSERVTAAELDILCALAAGAAVPWERNGAYIGALNDKLTRLGSGARIRYRAGEGYRLVT